MSNDQRDENILSVKKKKKNKVRDAGLHILISSITTPRKVPDRKSANDFNNFKRTTMIIRKQHSFTNQ